MRSLPGTTGWQQSFHTIWIWICGSRVHKNKNCRKWQILIVLYKHFLKISFKLIKCGLSYSLKRDPRSLSKCTKVGTILSLTASKKAFWRLPLIDWTFNWGQFYLSIKIELPDNQRQPPNCIFGGKFLYILRMVSNHILGCSWGHTRLIWMKFSENVGIIPIINCNLPQFLFTWTN